MAGPNLAPDRAPDRPGIAIGMRRPAPDGAENWEQEKAGAPGQIIPLQYLKIR